MAEINEVENRRNMVRRGAKVVPIFASKLDASFWLPPKHQFQFPPKDICRRSQIYKFLINWVWEHSAAKPHPIACCDITDFMLCVLPTKKIQGFEISQRLEFLHGLTSSPWEAEVEQTALYPNDCAEWGKWAYERVQKKPLTLRAACRELLKRTNLVDEGYLVHRNGRLRDTLKLRHELGLRISAPKGRKL